MKQLLLLGDASAGFHRLAALLFAHHTGRFGIGWQAVARDLGPAEPAKSGKSNPAFDKRLKEVQQRGVRPPAEIREPAPLAQSDIDAAAAVVAVGMSAGQLRERVAAQGLAVSESVPVEAWPVDEKERTVDRLEQCVTNWIAKALGGSASDETVSEDATAGAPKPAQPAKPKNQGTVKVGRETKGRKGKGVSIVADLPLNEAELLELAARLKGVCGSGGTVKEGRIEIQGDHRDRLTAELEKLGYKVKRMGG